MLTEREFADILADASKRIEGDVVWTADRGHVGAVEFRATVLSDAGYSLFVAGWYRPQTASLTFTLTMSFAWNQAHYWTRFSGLRLLALSCSAPSRIEHLGAMDAPEQPVIGESS